MSRFECAATTCRSQPSPGARAFFSCSATSNFWAVTRDSPGFPALELFGFELKEERFYYFLIWGIAIAALWATANLLDSRPGRAIRALRGQLEMAEAFGVDAARLKIVVFVYAALLASISGWLYAHLQRFVNPTPFSLPQGIEYLFMAVIGGAGSVWGAVIGATLITVAKQVLQDWLPTLLGRSGNFEMIVFGVLMVIVLQRAREGVWPWVAHWLPERPATPVPDAPPLPARDHAPSPGPLLEVRKARKQFGGLVAVNELSFAISPGEILGLIGPNGAGKTTMFNLISGALPLSAGDIVFRGASIAGSKPFEIARRGIGRTFQHVRLVPRMTVLDNVALGAYLRGEAGVLRAALHLDRGEERRSRAESARAIARVGLGRGARGPGRQPRARASSASSKSRARLRRPGLAAAGRARRGLALISKSRRSPSCCASAIEGMSVLLVEHDMDFVMELVDRLVVMDFGEKLAEGAAGRHPAQPRRARSLPGWRLTEAMTPLLEVRHLRVAYGKVEAVHHVGAAPWRPAPSSPSSAPTARARRRCWPR